MEDNEVSTALDRIHQAVIEGDGDSVAEHVNMGLLEKLDPLTMFNSLRSGIKEIGDRFGRGEAFITDLVASAEAMKAGARILEPVLLKSKAEIKIAGKIVIATVEGDIHDIGKNMVAVMFRADGFEALDLGVDVSTETFIEAVRNRHPDLVGMSALLTSTLTSQERVIRALNAAGLRDKVKVIVGGASVTDEWARQIRADGYAPDAVLSVMKAHELLHK
jgi:methylmalonyl-CoA mutase cobalamin-binding domain/chain